MRNLVSIFVAFLYLLGIMQVSVSFHYCGKHFKYVTINKAEEKKSCCKGKMKSHGCCTDKEVAYAIDDDQVTGTHYSHTVAHAPAIADLPFNRYLLATIHKPLSEIFQVSHSPPLATQPKRNVLYCTYLI